MKAVKVALACVLLVAASGVASAARFEKGSNLLSVQLTEGVADLVDPSAAGGWMGAYDHTELGAQVQFWHFLADGAALSVSGGVGFFGETDKPGEAVTDGTDFKYTQSSWQVRLGADRFAKLNDHLTIFGGPGVQFWQGKAKFDGGPGAFIPALESTNVTRWALEGRLGMHLALTGQVGMFCQLGHYFGYATASDKGSKTTWWPSGHDGAVGLAFAF